MFSIIGLAEFALHCVAPTPPPTLWEPFAVRAVMPLHFSELGVTRAARPRLPGKFDPAFRLTTPLANAMAIGARELSKS